MKRAFKIAATVAAMVLALSLFAACSDDDDDDEPSTKTYEATYGCEDGSTDALANYTVKVSVKSGNITAVTVGSTSASSTSDNSVWTVEIDSTTYTLTITGSGSTWYYTYEVDEEAAEEAKDYEATYDGTDTNALEDVTITVTASGSTISSVTATSSSDSNTTYTVTTNSGDTTTYSFRVDTSDTTSTVYTITLKYDSTNDAYTYTYTSVVTTKYTATGSLSDYTVYVYATDSGDIASVTVADDSTTYTVTTNSGDTTTTYSFTVGDEDGDNTVYTITPSVSTSGETTTASYTYTYVKTTTSDYTATASTAISDTTISVNATVVETYDGSSSTYEVSSVNSVTIGGTETSANSDGTYTYEVDDEDAGTTTVYTITISGSGSSWTYTYTSVVVTKYTATGALSDTVTVYVSDSTITAVTVGGTAATVSGSTATVTIDSVEYTLTITESSGSYSYTTALVATGALEDDVTVTLDSSGDISAVTVGETAATVSGSTATVTIDSVEYTLTISGSTSGGYTYTTNPYIVQWGSASQIITDDEISAAEREDCNAVKLTLSISDAYTGDGSSTWSTWIDLYYGTDGGTQLAASPFGYPPEDGTTLYYLLSTLEEDGLWECSWVGTEGSPSATIAYEFVSITDYGTSGSSVSNLSLSSNNYSDWTCYTVPVTLNRTNSKITVTGTCTETVLEGSGPAFQVYKVASGWTCSNGWTYDYGTACTKTTSNGWSFTSSDGSTTYGSTSYSNESALLIEALLAESTWEFCFEYVDEGEMTVTVTVTGNSDHSTEGYQGAVYTETYSVTSGPHLIGPSDTTYSDTLYVNDAFSVQVTFIQTSTGTIDSYTIE